MSERGSRWYPELSARLGIVPDSGRKRTWPTLRRVSPSSVRERRSSFPPSGECLSLRGRYRSSGVDQVLTSGRNEEDRFLGPLRKRLNYISKFGEGEVIRTPDPNLGKVAATRTELSNIKSQIARSDRRTERRLSPERTIPRGREANC
jgi:hypothetical protein